jgi:hypothetical protein
MFQDLAGLMQRVRFEIWDGSDVDVIVRVPVTEIIRLPPPPPPPPPSEPRRQLQFVGGWGTMTPIRWLVPAAQERSAREHRLRLQRTWGTRAGREEFFRARQEERAAREAMEDATPRWVQRTV